MFTLTVWAVVLPQRRLPALCALLLAVGVCAGAVPAMASAQEGTPPAADEEDCVRKGGEGRAGRPLRRSVKLVPDVGGTVVNFDGSRGWQFVDIVLNAKPAIPRSLRPEQIRFEVLRRFTRAAQNLRTTSVRPPRFTNARISPGRDRVTFTVCLNGSGLGAGTYAGNILVEGPRGLAPASISITANAKDSDLALFGSIGVLLLAFAFLVIRGAAARQARTQEEHASQYAAAKDNAERDAVVEKQAKAPTRLTQYIGDVFKDLNWWVTTVVALGLAAGTIYGIYSANPAWGEDALGSVISLVGPAFTAVGVQSVITSLGRSVGR
jgi:hypothetical protein